MPSSAVPAVHKAAVVARLPHPGQGFTQGLIVGGPAAPETAVAETAVAEGTAAGGTVAGSTVFESTGLYGMSALRRYRLGADREDECAVVPAGFFAEGICWADGHIWQLTWQERVALRWRPGPLTLVATVPYNRAGWGICHAGDCVLTSDGTSELVRRDPATLAPLGVLVARCAGQRITGLNDLAWSGGLVWANVLGRPYLAGIDPGSGEVVAIADARKADERHWGDPQAVMNGIAALPAPGEFLLTGKNWRHSYHIRLGPGRPHRDPARLLTGS